MTRPTHAQMMDAHRRERAAERTDAEHTLDLTAERLVEACRAGLMALTTDGARVGMTRYYGEVRTMESVGKLTLAEERWVQQIAARLPTHLGRGLNMQDAIRAAHEEQRAFAAEMALQQTERSKRAARVLSAVVWAEAQITDARRRAFRQATEPNP